MGRTRPREDTVLDQVQRWLKRHGAWFIKTHGSRLQRGLPDLVGCHHGRFFAIEVKRPGGRATRLQRHVLRRIRAAGGIAIVADSVADVAAALEPQSAPPPPPPPPEGLALPERRPRR